MVQEGNEVYEYAVTVKVKNPDTEEIAAEELTKARARRRRCSSSNPLPRNGGSDVKMHSRKKRKGAAYHEAGHAVISVALGIPFKEVSLTMKEVPATMNGRPGTGRYIDGVVFHEEDSQRWAAERERGILDDNHLLSMMAGGTAEVSAVGDRKEALRGADLDLATICQATRDEKTARAMAADAVHRVFPLIQEHWNEIVVVAESLLKEKTLTEDQVKLHMGVVGELPPA